MNGMNIYRRPPADDDGEVIDLLAEVKPSMTLTEAQAAVNDAEAKRQVLAFEKIQAASDVYLAYLEKKIDLGQSLSKDENEYYKRHLAATKDIAPPPLALRVELLGPDDNSPEIADIKLAAQAYMETGVGRARIAALALEMMGETVPLPTRPSRDEFFFQMAELASTMATCPRAHCGAVIVRHKRPLSIGYNGAPDSEDHCPSEGEALQAPLQVDHCEISTHAEINAIQNAVGNVYGATIYVYGHYAPCINCKGELARVGITDIRHRPGTHYGVKR
jgi:dCMP deaminase